MVNCSECKQYMSDYLDNRLADNRARELHAHCSECERCRSFLSTLLRLSLESRRRSKVEVPANLDARLRSTMALAATESHYKFLPALSKKRISVPFPIAALLAIFIIVSGAYFLLGPKDLAPGKTIKRQAVTQVMSLPVIKIENR